MRKFVLLLVPLFAFAVLQSSAQSPKSKTPYKLEFDPVKDVEQLTRQDGKEGIYIRVQFSITFDGANVDKIEGDHKIIIEENGHRVGEVDLPRPVRSEELSVMLALDTSGSMAEHRRMEQAHVAADTFLKKLSAKTDCGLILFDHEIRVKMPAIFTRIS